MGIYINEKIKNKLVLLDRAMVSTDDNYPTQYHIPLSDLIDFIKSYVNEVVEDALPSYDSYQAIVADHRFESWKDIRHLPAKSQTKQLVETALGEGFDKAVISIRNKIMKELNTKDS